MGAETSMQKHPKKRSLRQKFNAGFAIFGTLLFMYSSGAPAVSAATASQADLKSFLNGSTSSFYKPDFCAAGGGGGVSTATGPAAELLKKAGLAGGWVDAIIKFSKKYGTDPIAMASLFFWENRRFPPYGEIRNGNPSNGSGPWQFTSGSWNSKKYGSYDPNVYDPVKSTEAAAELVKSYGGVAGNAGSLGTIAQNFAKGSNIKSMASVAKNYNAGQGTWREPGVANWNQQGRNWLEPKGNWNRYPNKPKIIDDYIVGMTYVYYQIATGTKITWKGDDSYIKEALKKQDTLKNFKYTNSEGGSAADEKITETTETTGDNPVVVIDPGHSGKDKDIKDPQTGLRDHDYPNHPELEDMWDVSKLVEGALKQEGYSVILTKKSADETVTLRERANIANQSKAAIAVSLHDQAGKNGGLQFGKWAEIYPQKQGGYRETAAGKRVTFNNEDVAKKSEAYAKNFQETRAGPEGIKPTIKLNSFDGRKGLDGGNLPLVQLFSNVPWVYHEAGGNSAGRVGLSDGDKKKYAEGIINGIKKSVKPGTASETGDCSGSLSAGSGGVESIVDMALKLSWPEPFNGPKGDRSAINDPKQEYVVAAKQYNKSSGEAIIDCGRFVSTVMHASGADPNFPLVGTFNIEPYLKKHKEKYDIVNVNKVGDLVPGDILIVNQGAGAGGSGHIYLYIGKQKGGYDSAGASLGVRNPGKAPHLHNAYLSDNRGKYTVARLKQ